MALYTWIIVLTFSSVINLQEQPLLLEELLEQEKREQQQQQPPTQTSTLNSVPLGNQIPSQMTVQQVHRHSLPPGAAAQPLPQQPLNEMAAQAPQQANQQHKTFDKELDETPSHELGQLCILEHFVDNILIAR